tara:strand:- start:1665 stop:1811 length:147 start_codon:yes stop_codon:yes gene_type:complete
MRKVKRVKREDEGFIGNLINMMKDNKLEYIIGKYKIIVKPFSITIKKK